MSGRLLALAPMRIETAALRRGAPGLAVVRCGIGPVAAAATAARRLASLVRDSTEAVALAGMAGALGPGPAPGDLVVADRVVETDGTPVADLPSAPLLAEALRRAGLTVHVGPICTSERLVRSDEQRRRLAATGALAVDMESVSIARTRWGRPLALVRAVSDAPGRPLVSPATAAGIVAALRSLAAAAPVLEAWGAAAGQREVVLAGPRSSCAGVTRAIDTVLAALDRFGAPLYVRRQIVHNDHVIADLRDRGAVFVRELDEVPDGATVVFSAHGVAPAVRDEADRRGLKVIDATCPLVAKVHGELRRFRDRGHQLVLVGHPGHDEIEGSLGESDDIRLVETSGDVDALDLDPSRPVAYATQTTLAPDETGATVEALRRRYPHLVGPPASDICYATHNRQAAASAVARRTDLVLVVGSAGSSNTRRLVEVVERAGTPAHLVDDERDIDLAWLRDAPRVGVTAGASAPEALVERVVTALAGLGPIDLRNETVRTETVTFSLPQEVR